MTENTEVVQTTKSELTKALEEERKDALAEGYEKAKIELSASVDEKVSKAVEDALKAAEEEKRKKQTPEALLRGVGTPGVVTAAGQIPANVKRYNSVRSFKRGSVEECEYRAYRFGLWCMAAITGKKALVDRATEIGMPLVKEKVHVESDNSLGGFLVPEEFGNDMIDLREEYGVFRRNARIVPMSSDTKSNPRRKGGLTATWEGENDSGTTSTKQWDRVTLTAKKLYCTTRYSSELSEDAMINIGDDLAGEIGYAFAIEEDEAGFIGDGTSDYGLITGVVPAITTVYTPLTSDKKGIEVGSGDLMSEITDADLARLMGKLPRYAQRNAKWHCTNVAWGGIFLRLLMAAGGNTAAILQNGVTSMGYGGKPVEINEVMASTDTTSQILALYGDLRLAADFGDRRMITIAFNPWGDTDFDNDTIKVRGTQRIDINVHDVGSTTAAGPVVALVSASS